MYNLKNANILVIIVNLTFSRIFTSNLLSDEEAYEDVPRRDVNFLKRKEINLDRFLVTVQNIVKKRGIVLAANTFV